MSLKRILGILLVSGAMAGVAYFSTVGCCHLMGWGKGKQVSLTDRLGLTGSQAREVAEMDKTFLARKQASCEILCAKRAQMIQLLGQEDPDRELLARLVDEIGVEQASLEKSTMDHLLAVREKLTPTQRTKLAGLVTEQLRTACKATACGSSAGCFLKESSEFGGRSQE